MRFTLTLGGDPRNVITFPVYLEGLADAIERRGLVAPAASNLVRATRSAVDLLVGDSAVVSVAIAVPAPIGGTITGVVARTLYVDCCCGRPGCVHCARKRAAVVAATDAIERECGPDEQADLGAFARRFDVDASEIAEELLDRANAR